MGDDDLHNGWRVNRSKWSNKHGVCLELYLITPQKRWSYKKISGPYFITQNISMGRTIYLPTWKPTQINDSWWVNIPVPWIRNGYLVTLGPPCAVIFWWISLAWEAPVTVTLSKEMRKFSALGRVTVMSFPTMVSWWHGGMVAAVDALGRNVGRKCWLLGSWTNPFENY